MSQLDLHCGIMLTSSRKRARACLCNVIRQYLFAHLKFISLGSSIFAVIMPPIGIYNGSTATAVGIASTVRLYYDVNTNLHQVHNSNHARHTNNNNSSSIPLPQVAIKKVLQDRRFKNRELQIMRSVEHPNIVRLLHCFVSQTDKHDTYLYLVLEFVPDTLYRISKSYSKAKKPIPYVLVKLYAYQMCRALAALHR